MSSIPTASLRRRIALATGAGAFVLIGGAGVAYAAASVDDSVETGWSTVVEADPAATGDDGQDCPDQDGPDQGTSSRDGEL